MSRVKQSARIMAAAVSELQARPVRPAIDWGCIERVAAYRALCRARGEGQ